MVWLAFCSKCGNKLENEVKFCPNCGTQTDNSVTNAKKEIIPPQQPVSSKKTSILKIGCLGFLGVVILFTVIGVIFGGGKNDNKAVNTGQQQQEQKKEPVYDYTCNVEGIGKVKGMTASNVGVAIAKIQEMPTIDTPFSRIKAQGIFKVIYVVATNNQKDAVTLDANSYKLIDDQGREYTHSVDGETALQMSERKTLFLKSINPGITAGGWIAYDVPQGTNIVSLQFRGGFSGDKRTLPFKVVTE